MVPPTSWLFITCGALIGGLAIRFIGFRDCTQRHNGLHKYITTCLWLQSGIVVTTISTCLLKLTRLSILFEQHQTISFILCILGLIKFYPPTLNLQTQTHQDDSNRNIWKWIEWIIFWQVPSIYFSSFDFNILVLSTKCSYILYITCFTTGTIVPLHNIIVEDLGIRIAAGSSLLFLLGMGMKLTPRMISDSCTLSIIIHGSLITLLSGLLVDDIQHIKLQYELDSTDTALFQITSETTKKSIPLFLEITFIFGRIATLLVLLAECYKDD